MAAAILSCAVGCQISAPKYEAVVPETAEGKVLKTRDDVRALFPVAEWLEYEHNEGRFMFCANHQPSYGCSIIDVRGWVFRDHSGQWESVFVVQLNGVGGVTLSVNPTTQVFSAKGSANNAFLDQPAFTFDLRATQA